MMKIKSDRELLLFLPLFIPIIFLYSGVFPGEEIGSWSNLIHFLVVTGIFSWYIYLTAEKKEKFFKIVLPLLFLMLLTVLSFETVFIQFRWDIRYLYFFLFMTGGILLTGVRLMLFTLFSLLLLDSYYLLFHLYQGTEVLFFNFILLAIVVVANLIFFRERARRLEIESAYERLEREAQRLGGATLSGVDNPIDLLSKESLKQQTLREERRQQEEIYHTLRLLKNSLKPYSVIFFVYSQRKKKLLPWLYISDGEVNRKKSYSPGEGLIGQVFNSPSYLHLSELFSGLKGIDYYTRNEEIKSFLGIKVLHGEEPLGVLIVDSKIEQAFHEEHVKLLEIIAHQITFILENGEMRKQLTIELQRSRAFYELNKQLSSTLDLEALGNLLLSILPNLSLYDFGIIGVTTSRNTLKIVAARGDYEERVRGKSFSIENSLLKHVFHEKKVCKIDGRKNRVPIVERGLFPERDYSSILCIPLFSRDEILGVILLYSRDPEAFSLYERRNLEIIGHQLALTIRNAQLYREMEMLAIKDGLTGLYNRRYLENYLENIYREIERHQYHLSIIMCDIDHFKKINDTYGHKTGDTVLREVATVIRDEVREIDFVARYGGEEFVIVMKFEKEREACRVAERIRKRMAREKIEYAPGEYLSVTMSFGVASTSSGLQAEKLVEYADKALYVSKEKGRNRVTCFSKLK